VAFVAGQEQSSSTDCEDPTKLQNLVASKSTQNHSQSHAELGLSKEPGGIGTNLTQYSHGKEQFAKHGAANHNADRHYLVVIDDCIKRSGLNSAAPDFVPLSVRKSNTGDGVSHTLNSNQNVLYYFTWCTLSHFFFPSLAYACIWSSYRFLFFIWSEHISNSGGDQEFVGGAMQ